MKNARLIYLGGGDQSRFMNIALHTSIQTAIQTAYKNGATVAGTSAGAAMMAHYMITGNQLLGDTKNVRLSQASIETLPFADETFDFVMSIGVLHHIPDTRTALNDCVKKVKKGGYFFVYLYYNLEKRGPFYTALFKLSDLIRRIVSRLPGKLKHFVCDVLAIIFYMPFIWAGRFFKFLGFTDLAKRMPLHGYQNRSFFMIRNDTLDRFGTRLEQRFSEKEIIEMMTSAGLTDIIISPGIPLYHAVGKKV